jgi:protein-disulfide isomerase
MNKWMLLAVVVVAACQPDQRNLERKIDDLSKKVDQLLAQPRAGAAQPQQRARPPEPDKAKTYAVPIDGDPVDGPNDAKITIVKAYEYACPFCEKVRPTMDELRSRYGKDLRIVFKHLVVHPKEATPSALAMCAANKQGKFLQMDQLLWDKGYLKTREYDRDVVEGGRSVSCWETQGGCPIVTGFAKELGLDTDKFKTDLKECVPLVQKDQRELQVFGVGGTPAFFINGRFISGAQAVAKFVEVIDDELKKANERIAAGTPAASYYQQWVMDKGLKQLERNAPPERPPG